jgi:hypothetical protein
MVTFDFSTGTCTTDAPIKKIGGREGRPNSNVYGTHHIQCPCTLETKDDRLLCNDWNENRQSGDCLYLVGDTNDKDQQLHCWLGLRTP